MSRLPEGCNNLLEAYQATGEQHYLTAIIMHVLSVVVLVVSFVTLAMSLYGGKLTGEVIYRFTDMLALGLAFSIAADYQLRVWSQMIIKSLFIIFIIMVW